MAGWVTTKGAPQWDYGFALLSGNSTDGYLGVNWGGAGAIPACLTALGCTLRDRR